MVSDLLALQVQLGVLQLSCEPLALLLELLQCSLALITICLQVPKLEEGEVCMRGQQVPRAREGRGRGERQGAQDEIGTSSEPKT